jgi:hypothetical protein
MVQCGGLCATEAVYLWIFRQFVISAPGRYNWDALQKDFRILEGHTLQFRAESYNLSNNVSFDQFNTAYDGNGFGLVTHAAPARQLQFALRYQF